MTDCSPEQVVLPRQRGAGSESPVGGAGCGRGLIQGRTNGTCQPTGHAQQRQTENRGTGLLALGPVETPLLPRTQEPRPA